MRAGKLDKQITIERASTSIDDYGVVTPSWAVIKTIRAQKLNSAIDENETSSGQRVLLSTRFKIRWTININIEDRVGYNGFHFNIREIRELGRSDALELLCELVQ